MSTGFHPHPATDGVLDADTTQAVLRDGASDISWTNRLVWDDSLRKGIWPRSFTYWLVAVYLALFILRPWEILIPELGALHFERFMVLGVLGWVILRRGLSCPFNYQNLAMGLLVLAICATLATAYYPPKTQLEVVEFIGLGISFFLINKAVRTPYQLLFLVACYLVATGLYVVKSEWEYFVHGNAVWMMGVKRLQGICATHGHPNNFAASMLCSLPIAVFFVRQRKTFCRTWPRRLQWMFHRSLQLYIVCALVGILLTRSRAVALGLVFFGILFALRKRGLFKKIKYVIVAGLALSMALAFGPRDIRLRLQTMVDSSIEYRESFGGANASMEGRREGFLASVDAFQRHPFLGVGLGSFVYYRAAHLDKVGLNAHNLVGELLGETGLVGTLAFSLFLCVMVVNVRRLKRTGRAITQHHGEALYQDLGFALGDGILLLLFTGLASHNLQKFQWYWFAAFAVIALRFARDELNRVREEEDAYTGSLGGPA